MVKYAFCFTLLLFSLGCDRSTEDSSREPPNQTFWQLVDDSELTVTLSPWPLQSQGTTRIQVEATLGDWNEDKILVEQVLFAAVSGPPKSAVSWTPLRLAKLDQVEGSAYFETETRLPAGKVLLHFAAKGEAFDGGDAGELEAWELNVK